MQTKKRFHKSSKKTLVALIIIGLIIIISTLLYLSFNDKRNSLKSTGIPQEEKPKMITDGKAKSNQENPTPTSAPASSDPISNTKSVDSNGSYKTPTNSDSIVLSAKDNDSSVTILTELYGYSDGVCQLSIANGSRTVSKEAKVMFQSSYSMCAGFSIPKTDLGSGEWVIKLSVESGGVTQTKELSYEVN